MTVSVSERRKALSKILANEFSVSFNGFDRPTFTGVALRARDLLSAQPTPEKSLITLSEYLIGRDDLAALMVLGRVAYLDRRILIWLDGLFDLLIRYGENTGAGYVLNIRKAYEEGGPAEYERAIALLRTYNLLLWAARTAPNLSRMINALVSQMEYPHVAREIQERGGQRVGAPLELGGELPAPSGRRRRKRGAEAEVFIPGPEVAEER
ncbi:MAG: hypothetical protein QXP38_00095 [Nitrososphaerota archaeon]